MTDLQTSITTISEEQLNSLFDDGAVANIDENNLAASKVQVQKDTKDNVIQSQTSNIPYFDVDSLEEEAQEEEKQEEETPAEEIEAKKTKTTPKAAKKEEESTDASVVEVLKNTAKYYISKGLWKDFEGSEEALNNLTEEGYADLAEKQYDAILEERHNEKIAKTGDYGKAIFDYIENGGNPDEVIDLFKEQQRIELIPIDSEDGQKQLIEKFYTEVYDWTSAKAKKYIDNLVSNDELESEAQEVDTKYKEYFKKEVESAQLQQKVAFQAEQDRQKEFIKTINNKLTERKDFTEKERKIIQEAVFKYDKTLSDGTKVNAFYEKFAQMQKNPDDYLDLVNFVMNKEGYNAKVKAKEENKEVDKKWKWLAKNSATDKTKGSNYDKQAEKDIAELNWSSVLNRK